MDFVNSGDDVFALIAKNGRSAPVVTKPLSASGSRRFVSSAEFDASTSAREILDNLPMGVAPGVMRNRNLLTEFVMPTTEVHVDLNTQDWSESDYPKIVDCTNAATIDKAFELKSFLGSTHFKRDMRPLLVLYKQSLRRITILPYKAFERHSHVRAAFTFDPSAHVFPHPFDGFGDGIMLFRIKSKLDGSPVTWDYVNQESQKQALHAAAYPLLTAKHSYSCGIYYMYQGPSRVLCLVVKAGPAKECNEFLETMKRAQVNRVEAIGAEFNPESDSYMTMLKFYDCPEIKALQTKGVFIREKIASTVASSMKIVLEKVFDQPLNTLRMTFGNQKKRALIIYYKSCVFSEDMDKGFLSAHGPLNGYILWKGLGSTPSTFGKLVPSAVFQGAVPYTLGRVVDNASIKTLLEKKENYDNPDESMFKWGVEMISPPQHQLQQQRMHLETENGRFDLREFVHPAVLNPFPVSAQYIAPAFGASEFMHPSAMKPMTVLTAVSTPLPSVSPAAPQSTPLPTLTQTVTTTTTTSKHKKKKKKAPSANPPSDKPTTVDSGATNSDSNSDVTTTTTTTTTTLANVPVPAPSLPSESLDTNTDFGFDFYMDLIQDIQALGPLAASTSDTSVSEPHSHHHAEGSQEHNKPTTEGNSKDGHESEEEEEEEEGDNEQANDEDIDAPTDEQGQQQEPQQTGEADQPRNEAGEGYATQGESGMVATQNPPALSPQYDASSSSSTTTANALPSFVSLVSDEPTLVPASSVVSSFAPVQSSFLSTTNGVLGANQLNAVSLATMPASVSSNTLQSRTASSALSMQVSAAHSPSKPHSTTTFPVSLLKSIHADEETNNHFQTLLQSKCNMVYGYYNLRPVVVALSDTPLS